MVKLIKLLKLSLRVKNTDGLSIDEVVQWIYGGMENHCEFDYAEIEEKQHIEDELNFELRILIQERLSSKKTHETILKALKEYCDFDDVVLEFLEEFDGIWVKDDFSICESN